MACEYCLESGSHQPGCPNYRVQKAFYTCSICSEGICDGEEYIENESGEKIHYECVDGIRGLLSFLGHEVKTMELEMYGSDYWWW